MLYQIFHRARIVAFIPVFLFCAQDASMARRGLDHDAVTAATAVVAGQYRGEYKGAMASGTLNLRLAKLALEAAGSARSRSRS